MPASGCPRSSARINSRRVTSPSPRTIASTPIDGCIQASGREARIVSADDNRGAGLEGADQGDDPAGAGALERHHRQADDVGLQRGDQVFNGGADARLRQHQVGHRHLVVGVEVAGERGERAVRHADRDRRRVLERVGHREQQDLQPDRSPTPGRRRRTKNASRRRLQ